MRAIRLAVSVVVVVACAVAAPSRLGAQPLAEQVPAGALVYIGWGGSASAGSAYAQSRLKGVLESSDAKRLFTETLPALAQRLAQENADAAQGLKLASGIAEKMWRHPTAFYFAGIDRTNPRRPMPKMALLCDAGDDSAALVREIQSAIDAAGKAPTPMKVAARGNLVVLTIGPEAGGAAGAGGQGNLSADAQFKSAIAKVHANPVAAAYVNVEAIVKLIDQAAGGQGAARKGPPAQRQQQRWTKVRDALGLAGAKVAVWTGAFDGKDWSSKAFLAAPAPRQGIFALLDGEPLTDDLLARVPGSASMVAAGTFDPAKLITNLRATAGKIDPQAAKQIDQGLGQFKGMTGLDLQADVLEPLGPQWLAYTDPGVGGSLAFAMAFMNKLDDPAKAQDSLTRLGQAISNLAGGMLARKNMQLPFRELKDGDLTIRYIAAPIVRPAFAIKDGVLYAALYPQIVSSAIAKTPKQGASILENEQFAAVRMRLSAGQKVTGIKYLDLPRTAPLMYSTWLVLGGYAGIGDLFGVPVPAMLIPPLDDLLTHLAPAGSATWTDDAGWHLNGVTPFPGAQLVSSDPTINIAAPALGISILLPSLNRARETANRVKCASNMRLIGMAILLYANDNRGKYPPDLGTLLRTQDITVDVFTCPSSDNVVPPHIRSGEMDAQVRWVNDNASYTYVGAGLTNAVNAEAVVLYEKQENHDEEGMNLLFGDGHVEWLRMDIAQERIARPRPAPAQRGSGR